MSIKVNYKGAEILDYAENGTKTLKTGGKYCEDDITIQNTQDGGITPSGSIEITENGTYDVTEKASAVVNVSATSVNEAVYRSILEGTTTGEVTIKGISKNRNYAIYELQNITKITMPDLITSAANNFMRCGVAREIYLPKLKEFAGYNFYTCGQLQKVDFGALEKIEYTTCFTGTNNLNTVIIRTNAAIPLRGAISKFNSAYIYVPSALVNDYKSATNWSTYADQIRAIEDYPDICG